MQPVPWPKLGAAAAVIAAALYVVGIPIGAVLLVAIFLVCPAMMLLLDRLDAEPGDSSSDQQRAPRRPPSDPA
jgi:hypothetical protein